MKKYILMLGCFCALSSFQNEAVDQAQKILQEGLPIVNAIEEKDTLPGSFRMSSVLRGENGKNLNLAGLDSLHASGSSQFSEMGLDTIIKKLGQKKLTIVNLRQEDVGFLEPLEGNQGALAFSYLMSMPWWTGDNPLGNRAVEEIERSEEKKMAAIKLGDRVVLYGTGDSAAPYDKHDLHYKIDVVVKRALTEKQLVQEKGLGYFRIPDKKFGYMEYEHVDAFVEFIKGLDSKAWLHFHCKKGQSRTTLFMIMYDMMKNADRATAEEIIKRQGPLGLGGADLFGLPGNSTWDYSYKRGWKDFLYQFHRYCKKNKATHFAKPWTEWAEQKAISNPTPLRLKDYYKQTTAVSHLPEEKEVYQGTVFVLNGMNERKLTMQNFRTTQDHWTEDKGINLVGFENLYISGSNQYSKTAIEIFVEKIKRKGHPIVVVDLRHDDHIFVDGLNVSTFETKAALLQPRTPEEIRKSELALKELVLSQRGIAIQGIDTKYPKNEFESRFTLTIKPSTVELPEEVVRNLGADYLLIGSKRFSEAADEDIERLMAYVKKAPANTWYHFHCKKGKSRTTFFMVVFDMMRNASNLSMKEIIERQAKIGGANLFDVTAKDPSWKSEGDAKKQWVVFLARFHEYCKQNQGSGFEKTWTEWSKEQEDFQPDVSSFLIDMNETK